jgi:hypothetical protein
MSIATASGIMGGIGDLLCLIFTGIGVACALAIVGAYICTHVVRMKKCLVWTGLALFAFGIVVYLQQYVEIDCWLVKSIAAADSSWSSFFPSRGGYDYRETGAFARETGALAVAVYWLFHLAVLIYVSTIVMSVFGANFCNRLWLKLRFLKCRYSRRRHMPMNVFWGMCAEAEATAIGLSAKAGKTVSTSDDIIFALTDRRKSWLGLRDDESVHAIARKRYRWMFASVDAPGDLVKAERHFFFGANGQENVAAAEKLIVNLHRKPGKEIRVSVYVRISANADDDILYRWADRWNRDNDVVEVVVVREESLVAKRFLIEHPMLECPDIKKDTDRAVVVDGRFRILLLGFGAQGEALMGDMICDAQCLNVLDSASPPASPSAVPVMVDVFDKSSASFGWFKENCPVACTNYGIEFHRRNIHSAEFWRELKTKITKDSYYDRVVVCTRDDRTNISMANDIAKLYREIGKKSKDIVFARVRNKDVDKYLSKVIEDGGEDAPFTPFGRMTDTYSSDVVIVDKWDRGAMWLNWKWSKQEERSREEVWRETSFFDRESSRASFFGLRKLLRLMGYEVDEQSMVMQYGRSELTDEKLETLAETEHMRWMAFHFVRGVKVWNPEAAPLPAKNPDGTQPEVKANRRKDINAHAALVGFAELPKVDDWLWRANGCRGMKGCLQQIDRDFVLSIVPAMKEAGFGISRIPERKTP